MATADHPTRSIVDVHSHAGSGVASYAASGAAPSPVTDRYVLGDEIARGGMGIVYRATDTVLGREVAVKVLQEKYAPESGAAVRFADEARITSQLQHPSIPPVHDLGRLADGRPFLAMKLIKGQTLEDSVNARTDPSADGGQFVAVFEQICQALAYAHSHDVIHRDLKPANVMVGAFGEVQVMDWGLAKVLGAETPARPDETANEATRAWTQISPTPDAGWHTQAGSLLGTPAYASPEQVAGELEKVDVRADVFGLGAILAVLLTGKPPYVGETAETVRVQALRGKLDDCFARLASCGAEPELVALCKRCLAFEPADRPANAGELAKAVAELRAAADERARQAELDRVAAEAAVAASKARAAERRKRRQVWTAAAAALVVAVVGGLSAVLIVQARAKADLAAKNQELAEQQAEVEARFETAQKAIATFHTGVSEDALLKNDNLKELRAKLLKEAAGFYADLEKLLAGKTDPKSRKLLAAGYFQLGELTFKIGDHTEALAIHRKALSIRRELAAKPGADIETRLDAARSLHATGSLLLVTGDSAAALVMFQEQRDLATTLEVESPTDAVRVLLAYGHNGIGFALDGTGKSTEAIDAFRKALAIYQKLPDEGQYPQPNYGPTFCVQMQAGVLISIGKSLLDLAKPADGLESYLKASDIMQKLADAHADNTLVQSYLALCHLGTGVALIQTGKPAEAIATWRKALDIHRKLVEAHPAVTEYQSLLAYNHHNIGVVLLETGKPGEALAAYEQARAIRQKLAAAHPAVTQFQTDLADAHNNIGVLLLQARKPAEALAAYEPMRAIRQKLADANPAVTSFQSDLAHSHNNIATVLLQSGKTAEALAAYEQARAIRQKQADANPAVTQLQSDLAHSLNNIGVVLSQTGKPAEALAAYEQARAIQQKLADANPTIPSYMSTLATNYNNMGRLQARQKHFAQAFTALDRGLALRQKLADAHPTTTLYTSHLGYSYAYRGGVHVRGGHAAEAVADLRHALELWDKAKATDNETRFERARALAILAGLGGDAKSGVTKDEVKTFADQAVAALADAIKAGWAQLDELKEPDFDAVRKRDDFQKLVAEVESKAKKPATGLPTEKK